MSYFDNDQHANQLILCFESSTQAHGTKAAIPLLSALAMCLMSRQREVKKVFHSIH